MNCPTGLLPRSGDAESARLHARHFRPCERLRYRLSPLFDSFEGLQDRENFRAIVVLNDDVSDRELERLDAIGVRGVRFHIAARYEAHSEGGLAAHAVPHP